MTVPSFLWSCLVRHTMAFLGRSTQIPELSIYQLYDPSITHKPTFIKDKTSCFVLSCPGDVMRGKPCVYVKSMNDTVFCSEQTLFGGHFFNRRLDFDYAGIKRPNYRDYVTRLDMYILHHQDNQPNIPRCDDRYKPRNVQVTYDNAICKWSLTSSDLTSWHKKLFTWQSILPTVPFRLPPDFTERDEYKSFIQRTNMMQKLVMRSKPLPQDLYVFKTARLVIYNSEKSVQNLQVGDEIFQPFFNSATINRALDNAIAFASFQVRSVGFIIKIPAGTNFYYMGTSRLNTGHPDEYEALLPLGCRFRIDKVFQNKYIGGPGPGGTKVFYQMRVYMVTYIPPTFEDVFSLDQSGKIVYLPGALPPGLSMGLTVGHKTKDIIAIVLPLLAAQIKSGTISVYNGLWILMTNLVRFSWSVLTQVAQSPTAIKKHLETILPMVLDQLAIKMPKLLVVLLFVGITSTIFQVKKMIM